MVRVPRTSEGEGFLILTKHWRGSSGLAVASGRLVPDLSFPKGIASRLRAFPRFGSQ